MVSLRFQGSLNRVAEFSDRTRINRPIQSESEDLCRNSTGRSRPLCSSLPSHLRLCSRYRSRTAAFSVGLPLWAEVLVVGLSVAWSPSSRSFFSQVLLSFRSNKRTRDSRWLLVHDISPFTRSGLTPSRCSRELTLQLHFILPGGHGLRPR